MKKSTTSTLISKLKKQGVKGFETAGNFKERSSNSNPIININNSNTNHPPPEDENEKSSRKRRKLKKKIKQGIKAAILIITGTYSPNVNWFICISLIFIIDHVIDYVW